MYTPETKKLALIRILQILKENSDYDHPLTQEEIAYILAHDYGIEIERKAVGRNIALLKEAGYEIESGSHGSYLKVRDFDDSELHMLIDGVLSSKYITAKHSKDLINRLSNLSNKYFRSHIKYVYSVNEWSKTDNQALFLNIDLIDEAIEKGLQVEYDYNKFGTDKKMHKSSFSRVSPYQLILHNQRYYLMGYSEYWKQMKFHRLDHITNMCISERKAVPLKNVKGYEKGMDFKKISSAMPYMFTDNPEIVEFLTKDWMIDQVLDWFGKEVNIVKLDGESIKVTVTASINAMEYWAMQYLNYVEIISPITLRDKIKENIQEAEKKYK